MTFEFFADCSFQILNLSECNRIEFDISQTASPRAEYWSGLEKPQLRSLCVRSVVTLNDLALLRLVRLFPELRILDVSFSNGRITDKGIEAIALSTLGSSLLSLNLWGALITDRAIERLCNSCCKIRTITIADCRALTENSMLMMISKLRSLKTLTMWGATGISSASIQLFLKYFPDLYSLGLNHCSQVQDHSLQGLATSTLLRNIELDGCHLLTDAGLVNIGGESVQSVNLRGCTKLTGLAITELVQRCPNMAALTLCRTALSEAEYRSILSEAPKLAYLSISVGANINGSTLTGALENGLASRLVSIKLDSCTLLSDDLVQSILFSCPCLTARHTNER